MSAHLYRPITDSAGNILPGTSVRVLDPGTEDLVATTLYDRLGGVIVNPFVADDGIINFYLTLSRDVRIGLTPLNAPVEVFIDDVSVLTSSYSDLATHPGSGADTVQIGPTAQTGGDFSVAVGAAATTGASSLATALGAASQSQAISSTAIGAQSTATGAFGLAVGAWAVAGSGISDIESTAVGGNASSAGDDSTALGYGAEATFDDSTALGATAQAQALRTTAVGRAAQALGEESVAVGQGALADTEWATVVGEGVQGLGDNVSVLGHQATATGSGGVALGQGAQAGATAEAGSANSVERPIAVGQGSQAMHNRSVAIGGVPTTADDQAVIGAANLVLKSLAVAPETGLVLTSPGGLLFLIQVDEVGVLNTTLLP